MLDRSGYDALGAIYDSAIDMDRWTNAIDAVAVAVGGRTGALLIRGKGVNPYQISALGTEYTRNEEEVRFYVEHLSHHESAEWDALNRQPVRRPLFDDSTGLSAAELDQRADYVFLREKIGIRRRLGVRLNENKVWFDAMTVGFGTDILKIPDHSVQQLTGLLDHIAKAVEIGRSFSELRARYAAVLTALDHVQVGIAIALPSGEIIVSNDEAKRIFSETDGIRLSPDKRIRCRDEAVSASLDASIVNAASTARGEADQPETLLTVSRSSGASPYLVEIAPLNDGSCELDAVLQGALVTIIDPNHVPRLKIERFALLYGLTGAETEVCDLVLSGLKVGAIAEIRETSSQTTKSQIASLLAKTGTSRRTELTRLLIRVLPPIG